MIKQVILLSIFFLGLSGCDGFWENIYVGDKVYEGEKPETTEIKNEEVVLRIAPIDTPLVSGWLFERTRFAKEQKFQDINRVFQGFISDLPGSFLNNNLEVGKKYKVDASYLRTDLYSCRMEMAPDFSLCEGAYDIIPVAKYQLTSLEPIP